eukprot:jgi/Mesvir1/14914/Mv05509-RA.1
MSRAPANGPFEGEKVEEAEEEVVEGEKKVEEESPASSPLEDEERACVVGSPGIAIKEPISSAADKWLPGGGGDDDDVADVGADEEGTAVDEDGCGGEEIGGGCDGRHAEAGDKLADVVTATIVLDLAGGIAVAVVVSVVGRGADSCAFTSARPRVVEGDPLQRTGGWMSPSRADGGGGGGGGSYRAPQDTKATASTGAACPWRFPRGSQVPTSWRSTPPPCVPGILGLVDSLEFMHGNMERLRKQGEPLTKMHDVWTPFFDTVADPVPERK